MNKKLIFCAVFALLTGASGMAQEKLFNGSSVQSPVKNADGTVTFNLYAPAGKAGKCKRRLPADSENENPRRRI